MNIKDFLIDNYIWIIVIILITIITIIGFLADKKKGDKKKESVPNLTSNPNNMAMNDQQPMMYQQPFMQQNDAPNNNNGMNYNNPIPQVQNGFNQNMASVNVTPIVTEPTPVPVNIVPANNANQMNNPMPVENVVPRVEQESMYQPLSEQKPIIAPQPIPNFSEPVNNIGQPIIQNTTQNLPNVDFQNVIPTPVVAPTQQMNNNLQIPVNNEPMLNQVSNYNIPNNDSNLGMDNQPMISNINQNVTIPQPVNNFVTPQPVTPQPIMTNTYNNPQILSSPSYNQPEQQSHIESTVNQTSQPINFVYGPQNNNQNM